jgi:hypothetical protein
MATVTVNWQNNVPVNSSATPGNVLVSITGGPAGTVIPSVSVPVGAITATISNVPTEAATDPDYVVAVQEFDTTGVAIGVPQLSAPFSVLTPPAVLQTPGNVTVTVA